MPALRVPVPLFLVAILSASLPSSLGLLPASFRRHHRGSARPAVSMSAHRQPSLSRREALLSTGALAAVTAWPLSTAAYQEYLKEPTSVRPVDPIAQSFAPLLLC